MVLPLPAESHKPNSPQPLCRPPPASADVADAAALEAAAAEVEATFGPIRPRNQPLL
jgi:hypothetical protein